MTNLTLSYQTLKFIIGHQRLPLPNILFYLVECIYKLNIGYISIPNFLKIGLELK